MKESFEMRDFTKNKKRNPHTLLLKNKKNNENVPDSLAPSR